MHYILHTICKKKIIEECMQGFFNKRVDQHQRHGSDDCETQRSSNQTYKGLQHENKKTVLIINYMQYLDLPKSMTIPLKS